MLDVSRCRLVIGVGLCLALPILHGCQEPDGQSASVVNAPAPSGSVASTASPVGLSIYQPSQTINPWANCNLETVDGQAFGSGVLALQSDHANVFKGWLDAAGIANPIYRLRFDSADFNRHLQAPLSLTEQRPDVAAAHPGASMASGFDLELPSGALPVGSYHVYLAVESGGKAYVCDSGRHIDVQ